MGAAEIRGARDESIACCAFFFVRSRGRDGGSGRLEVKI